MKKLLNISKKFILYIFLLHCFFIETSFSDDLKKIDIHNSVIHFIEKKNSWRTNIESILITENKKIYLVKECRAEKVGEHPFLHIGRYEFLGITENDIEKAKQTCYSIYQDLQAILAGQSMTDVDTLENQFNEICAEFGLNVEDTYEWCENNHSASYGL